MATSCLALSRRVQALCGILLLSEAVVVLAAAFGLTATYPTTAALFGLLGGVWMIWVVTQVENYRLVRCGPLRERFAVAPLAINQSAPFVRMAFHLLVNWSAIATTLLVMLLAGPNETDRRIAYLCAAATLLVWLAFNLMHRRMNRSRNLLFTTSVAGGLLVLSAIVVMR